MACSHEEGCNVNYLVLGFSRYTKFEACKHLRRSLAQGGPMTLRKSSHRPEDISLPTLEDDK